MLTFPAPAKVNLFLHIIGRRQDGYHLLQTVFRFLDFSDQLSFKLRTDDVIKLHNPIAGVPEEKDLCVRAARLLKQTTGITQGVDIFLQKQIPIGGGLGGGSSDAATTLLALNQLWKVNLNSHQLLQLGLQLGADVPVFIYGRSAFAEGIGEKLTAIELPPAWYLVLVPQVQVSTAEIFSSKELTRNTLPIKIPPFSVWQGHNDLESVVCGLYSEVAGCLEWLKRLENTTIAAMSGSGACVFAEFATELAARAAFAKIPDNMQGFVAKGLDDHPMYKLTE
jgi:4-diphosphocytidyl-2-C-methyl-D-erythritol kinase